MRRARVLLWNHTTQVEILATSLTAVWPETGFCNHSGLVSWTVLQAAWEWRPVLYAFRLYSSHLEQWHAVISMWYALRYLLNKRRNGKSNHFYRVGVRVKWNSECKLHRTGPSQLIVFLSNLDLFIILYSGSGLVSTLFSKCLYQVSMLSETERMKRLIAGNWLVRSVWYQEGRPELSGRCWNSSPQVRFLLPQRNSSSVLKAFQQIGWGIPR